MLVSSRILNSYPSALFFSLPREMVCNLITTHLAKRSWNVAIFSLMNHVQEPLRMQLDFHYRSTSNDFPQLPTSKRKRARGAPSRSCIQQTKQETSL
jgi:hypothetical protein